MGELDARWSALVASGRARWCPGMLVHQALWPRLRVVHVGLTAVRVTGMAHDTTGAQSGWPPPWRTEAIPIDQVTPDWTDPATLGCLLGLVREAWGDPHAIAAYSPGFDMFLGQWAVMGRDGRLGDHGATEAEALIAALEAAKEGA